MTNEIISAGFGGQGVLLLGQLITYAGMIEGYHVSWLPSYGPEMRGGTANCCVVVSDEPVGSPVVTEADAVIVLNRPSLDKFENSLKPGGKLFINSSLIEKKASRGDVNVYYIPANDIALSLGNVKVANMAMLGAYVKASGIVKKESIIKALGKALGEKKLHLIPINEQAFDEGAKRV
ncbi:MAG: 2-oxoacid:acceptor oxidoreductase family protein [Eubacteriales bacterium]|nr:2-oxoacid:acceptor oxidoreductase family protein [Eubacteriales bacterium]